MVVLKRPTEILFPEGEKHVDSLHLSPFYFETTGSGLTNEAWEGSAKPFFYGTGV